jgi:hypothetical protein
VRERIVRPRGLIEHLRAAVDKTREKPERVDGPLLGFLAGGWLALGLAWKLTGLDLGAAAAIAGSCLAIGLASIAIWDLVVRVFRIQEEYFILPPHRGRALWFAAVPAFVFLGAGMLAGHWLWQ